MQCIDGETGPLNGWLFVSRSSGGVRTLIALHCGSNIFNMAAKAEEVGWF